MIQAIYYIMVYLKIELIYYAVIHHTDTCGMIVADCCGFEIPVRYLCTVEGLWERD